MARSGQQAPPRLTDEQKEQVEEVVQDPSFDAYVGNDDDKLHRLSADVEFDVPEDSREQLGGLEGGRISFSIEFSNIGGRAADRGARRRPPDRRADPAAPGPARRGARRRRSRRRRPTPPSGGAERPRRRPTPRSGRPTRSASRPTRTTSRSGPSAKCSSSRRGGAERRCALRGARRLAGRLPDDRPALLRARARAELQGGRDLVDRLARSQPGRRARGVVAGRRRRGLPLHDGLPDRALALARQPVRLHPAVRVLRRPDRAARAAALLGDRRSRCSCAARRSPAASR